MVADSHVYILYIGQILRKDFMPVLVYLLLYLYVYIFVIIRMHYYYIMHTEMAQWL